MERYARIHMHTYVYIYTHMLPIYIYLYLSNTYIGKYKYILAIYKIHPHSGDN